MVAATRCLLSCVESRASWIAADQRVGARVEQREVEIELAGEVLVEHRLADPGPVGDLVHRGGVVALGDEHLLRGGQQLQPALSARQPGPAHD